MKMHIARRLSEAVGSALHYEFCCHRAGLFNENYLKSAVGGVLSSFPTESRGVRVHADFPHDALNPIPKRGKPSAVDFALILSAANKPKSGAEVLVETKWAGSSHCSPSAIFKDLLRLAILKSEDPKSICIFMLAGNHKNISQALSHPPFSMDGTNNTGIGYSGKEKRLTPDNSNPSHRKHLSSTINELHIGGLRIPKSFTCRAHGLHPLQTDQHTVKFQAIAWEVKDVSKGYINPSHW